ncbi:hypothetical protein PINS_up004241 [Pythium insidiosum]|nr:hypothetical protein PINS_up004241 [Pythium insidiosum]
MERVLEALHCNMWRSMVMLPRDAASVPSKGPVTPEIKLQRDEDAGNQEEEKEATSPVDSSAAAPAATEETQEKEEETTTTTASAPSESHADRLQASLAALGLGNNGDAPGDDQDDDTDMEMLGNLISQVRRIRETGHTLSDEERRRQAERVAMQLWSLMGVDDDEEDEQ